MIYNHTNSSSESYGNLGNVRVVTDGDGTWPNKRWKENNIKYFSAW
jgi:hypothetical protein